MSLPSDPQSRVLELSVVLAVHNENPHIEDLLRNWLEELRYEQISFEMIVVNDGSLDGTGRVLDRLRKDNAEVRLVHQLNLGRDRAIRRAYELAKGQYVLAITGNGRIEPSDFLLLWKERARGYLVLSKRSHRLDSYLDRKLSKFLSSLAKYFFNHDLAEPDCNLRLCLKEIIAPTLKQIPANSQCLNWSLSILTEKLFPGRVIEVTVPYRHRLERRSPFRRKSVVGIALAHFFTALRLNWLMRSLQQSTSVSHLRESSF